MCSACVANTRPFSYELLYVAIQFRLSLDLFPSPLRFHSLECTLLTSAFQRAFDSRYTFPFGLRTVLPYFSRGFTVFTRFMPLGNSVYPALGYLTIVTLSFLILKIEMPFYFARHLYLGLDYIFIQHEYPTFFIAFFISSAICNLRFMAFEIFGCFIAGVKM